MRMAYLFSIYNDGKLNELFRKYSPSFTEYLQGFDKIYTVNYDSNVENGVILIFVIASASLHEIYSCPSLTMRSLVIKKSFRVYIFLAFLPKPRYNISDI